MRTFIVTHGKLTGEIEFKYNNAGLLIKFEVRAELDDILLRELFEQFPIWIHGISTFQKHFSDLTINEIKADLSFNEFWNRYNYKVGNKARTEKLWNALNDAEKLAVFLSLPKYDNFLTFRRHQDKCYAETYLNQRKWECEYKINYL